MREIYTLSFRFDSRVRAALEAIKKRDGVPYNEQMRRAVDMWITARLSEESEKPTMRKVRHG